VPEFLRNAFAAAPVSQPGEIAIRLVLAVVLGMIVAAVYRATRHPTEIAPTFPGTLVLLAALIAMVTQVIGDNIARAFSLVGALSIVRFRTVVRDTQDTAFVIFAVVIGMAVGARDPVVATIGLGIVGVAAFPLMTWQPRSSSRATSTGSVARPSAVPRHEQNTRHPRPRRAWSRRAARRRHLAALADAEHAGQ